MPKRSRKKQKGANKKPKPRQPKRDENQAAFAALQKVIQQTEGTGKNPLAVALGRLGGLKGGRARAAAMSQEARSASARVAAISRWSARKEPQE